MDQQQLKTEHRAMTYVIAVLASVSAFFSARTFSGIDDMQKSIGELKVEQGVQKEALSNLERLQHQHEQRDEKIFEKTQMQLGSVR